MLSYITLDEMNLQNHKLWIDYTVSVKNKK